MSGLCIDKLGHDCGTRDGLQVFAQEDGKVNGYCFSCNTFVAHPYGKPVTVEDVELPEPPSEEEIAATLAEVDGYPTVDIPERKLRAKDLEKFGVKVALSEKDGVTPTAMYFPMTKQGRVTGYYVKSLGEKKLIWSVGDVKECEPFGWEQARKSGAYRIYVTEGLEDAVSVLKIFATHGKEEYLPAVVSLPNGTNSVKSLGGDVGERLKEFKELVFNFDDDKAGQKAVEEAMILHPEGMSVTLPYKDANECVIKGAMKAAHKALSFNMVRPKNTRLVSGNDLHEAARTPTPYGELTWPYPTMDKLLRGIRYGETIYIGAGVKMGKSELLNDLAAHFIKVHNVPVFMAKPEEENKKTYKLIAGKIVGKVFHDPDREFDFDAYDEAGEVLKDKLWMINLYQHLGWSSLKKDIIMAANLGAKVIFIDPITNLTNGVDSGEANVLLQEIAQETAALAKDLNIVVFMFCHLKAPENNISKDVRMKKYEKGQFVGLGNCPHEFGGDVLSNQFAGSRAMMRSCNLMIGMEGNKDDELDREVRNMRYLKILEDREFGNSAKVGLYWNHMTTLFKEVS